MRDVRAPSPERHDVRSQAEVNVFAELRNMMATDSMPNDLLRDDAELLRDDTELPRDDSELWNAMGTVAAQEQEHEQQTEQGASLSVAVFHSDDSAPMVVEDVSTVDYLEEQVRGHLGRLDAGDYLATMSSNDLVTQRTIDDALATGVEHLDVRIVDTDLSSWVG